MAAGYPLPAPPPTPGMSRGTRVLLWSLGGCGVLVVLLFVGGIIFGLVVASRTVNVHLDARAPVDFPVYPGSKMVTGLSVGARDQGPSGTVTLVQWGVTAPTDRVASWYREHLTQGDWAIDGEQSGIISFHRRSTGEVASLAVRNQVTQTLVQLEMGGEHSLQPGG